MKTKNKTKSFLVTQALLTISLVFLSSCLKSSYGSGDNTSLLNTNASNNIGNAVVNDDFVISEYTAQGASALVGTRALATSSSSLDFIEDVDSAEYSIVDSKLTLRLYDSFGVKITIPSEFSANSRFKDTTGGLILVKLSNASLSTYAVVHKITNRVFITKDSAVSAISLSSPNISTAQYEDETLSVLKVKAIKTSSPTSVINVGLVFLEDSLLAIEL